MERRSALSADRSLWLPAVRDMALGLATTKGAADGFKQAQLKFVWRLEVAHAMLFVLVGWAMPRPASTWFRHRSGKGAGKLDPRTTGGHTAVRRFV